MAAFLFQAELYGLVLHDQSQHRKVAVLPYSITQAGLVRGHASQATVAQPTLLLGRESYLQCSSLGDAPMA